MKQKINLPDNDFPHYGNYRCVICDSREGPFFEDRCDPQRINMICSECNIEVSDVRFFWEETEDLDSK